MLLLKQNFNINKIRNVATKQIPNILKRNKSNNNSSLFKYAYQIHYKSFSSSNKEANKNSSKTFNEKFTDNDNTENSNKDNHNTRTKENKPKFNSNLSIRKSFYSIDEKPRRFYLIYAAQLCIALSIDILSNLWIYQIFWVIIDYLF